ncbi:MAG TPA: VWA domain-containing protein, partial [Thermoanaerobacterales bacterium]|nr:VWA domain-containing protein [Thermoanaerobacterales bacterium]
MDNVMINQIILVTDGQSNVGGDPALAAYEAASKGIIVNAIGIIDGENTGIQEVKNIAQKGNGKHQLVEIKDLASSMVLVTQQSMQATLEQVVNAQLKELIDSEITEIIPDKRGAVFEFIEKMQDEIPMRCLILVDTSGSMVNKLQPSRDSIISLFKSFEVRTGEVSIGVMAFPGNKEHAKIICPFTDNIHGLDRKLLRLQASGNTPTAPAIRAAISYISGDKDS